MEDKRQPFVPHPNLAPEVNEQIVESDLMGGVELKDIAVGARLLIQTQNTKYFLTKLGEDDYVIQGHTRYYPEPTKVHIAGSTWGGSMLRLGFIGRGMYMEMVLDGSDGIVTTSAVQEIIEL